MNFSLHAVCFVTDERINKMNGTIKITDAVYVVRDLEKPIKKAYYIPHITDTGFCSTKFDTELYQQALKEWQEQTRPVKVKGIKKMTFVSGKEVYWKPGYNGGGIRDGQSCEYHIEDQEAIITKLI